MTLKAMEYNNCMLGPITENLAVTLEAAKSIQSFWASKWHDQSRVSVSYLPKMGSTGFEAGRIGSSQPRPSSDCWSPAQPSKSNQGPFLDDAFSQTASYLSFHESPKLLVCVYII